MESSLRNMPDFLKSPFVGGPGIAPLEVLVRLLIALALGALVAWIYRATRKSAEMSASFSVTLVLLAILIAMVTQVIGDNIARAFSLVGALSIVRFRTVVRDTQDTAYVIFAVVVGMAVGAKDLWVGIIGIGVVGFAAYLMMARAKGVSAPQPAFLLRLRVVPWLVGNRLHLLTRESSAGLRRFLIFSATAKATTTSPARSPTPAIFRTFLLQKFEGGFAFDGVEALVAIPVELFHQLGFLLHAARPAESATSRSAGTEWRRAVETGTFFRQRKLARRTLFPLGRMFRSLG